MAWKKAKKRRKKKLKPMEQRTRKDLRLESKEDEVLFEGMKTLGGDEPLIYAYDSDWRDESAVNAVGEADVIFVPIQKRDIESLNVGMITDALRVGDKAIGGVVFSVSGYEHDPRTLMSIPAFVSWARKAHEVAAYWPHLWHREALGFATQYFGALAGFSVVSRKKGVETVVINRTELTRVVCEALILDQFTADLFGVVDVEDHNDRFLRWVASGFNE